MTSRVWRLQSRDVTCDDMCTMPAFSVANSMPHFILILPTILGAKKGPKFWTSQNWFVRSPYANQSGKFLEPFSQSCDAKKKHQPCAFYEAALGPRPPSGATACRAHRSRDPDFEWAKKTLMTGDGTKCGERPVGYVGYGWRAKAPCARYGPCSCVFKVHSIAFQLLPVSWH